MKDDSSSEVSRAEAREKVSRDAAMAALREHAELHEKIAPNQLILSCLGYALAEARARHRIRIATVFLLLGCICFVFNVVRHVSRHAVVLLPACLLLATSVYFNLERILGFINHREVLQRVKLRLRVVTPKHVRGISLVLYNFPSVLEIFGQVNLLWFMHKRPALSTAVLVTTAPILAVLFVQPQILPESWKRTGRRKMFKFSVQVFALCFCCFWNSLQDPLDIIRLCGPVAINTAGIILATLPEHTISEILCTSVRSVVVEVVTDVETIVREDTGLILVLFKWLSDWWKLPCDFDWTNIPSILRDEAASLGCSFATKLGQRISAMDLDKDAEPLVRSVQSYTLLLPPTRRTAAIMLVARTCPTTIAALLLLDRCSFVFPALGFVCVEFVDLYRLLPALQDVFLNKDSIDIQPNSQSQSDDAAPLVPRVLKDEKEERRLVVEPSMDGLDVLLLSSIELRSVWEKFKYAISCLHYSLTGARVCQTGVKTVSLASRMISIALVVKSMREQGSLNPSALRWLLQEQKALKQVCGNNETHIDSGATNDLVKQSDVVGSILDVGVIVNNIIKLTCSWQESRQEAISENGQEAICENSAKEPTSLAPSRLAAAGSWISGWLPLAKAESEMTEEEKASAAERETRREKWRQARRRMHGNA